MLRPFKFIVRPIILETNEDGEPVGELVGEEQVFYGTDALARFAEEFDSALKTCQETRANLRGPQDIPGM